MVLSEGLLLFQQAVDTLNIVETVVLEETQFGDDAQLVVNPLAEVVAYGLLVLAYVFEEVFCFLRREDAEISRADAQVRTYLYARHAYEDAMGLARLALKNLSELFLQQS